MFDMRVGVLRKESAQEFAADRYGDVEGISASPVRGTFSGTIGLGTDKLARELDLLSWESRRKELLSYTRQRGVGLLRALVMAYFNAVTEYTPVRTGNAKSNWTVREENETPIDYVDRKDLVVKTYFGLYADNQPWIDELLEIQRDKIYASVRSDVLLIENHTPYIQMLDVGYSDQAPGGMTVYGEAAVHKTWDDFHSGSLLKKAEAVQLGSKR